MHLDYVTRRFNASSAGLNKPVGLDLRWDPPVTAISRSNWSPESAEVSARLVPSSARNWLQFNAVKKSNLNKNVKRKNYDSTNNKKFD